ncbi:MAG: hypothetical protein K2L21_01905 [Muribaculaceae bacterium]|nr:hypothetical protein [Muribaculaceae bacterium]
MRLLLTITTAVVLATSCGPTPAADSIEAARMSLESGDVKAARRGAEHAAADTATLSGAQLCRLALVYASVGEHQSGNEADMAMAARCIRKALATDSAAVDSFTRTLPVEQRALMALAVQLCRAQDTDISEFEEEPIDNL